jgi:hypothetical protein
MTCSVTVSAPVSSARHAVVVTQTTLADRFDAGLTGLAGLAGLADLGSSGLADQQA